MCRGNDEECWKRGGGREGGSSIEKGVVRSVEVVKLRTVSAAGVRQCTHQPVHDHY